MHTVETSPPSRDIVCSLFEGNYHLGVAVLLNSLLNSGFTGTFRLGYRGELPPWTDQLERIGEADIFQVNDQAVAIFEKIDTEYFIANYKPRFLRKIIETDPTLERLFFFDPDITSQASWAFYRRWTDLGVAICEEAVHGTMPVDHPLRLMWVEFMRSRDWGEPRRALSRYYNGGFIGVSRERKGLLDLWDLVLTEAVGVNLDKFKTGNREKPFHATDQDALNIAAMYSEEELSTIGPEGMGFVGGGFTMYHANQGTKPWEKSFLREAISGKPPTIADRLYLRHANGPIFPFSRRDLQLRQFACNVATFIGRFYRR